MKKLLTTLIVIFSIATVRGQDVTQNISSQEANDLLKSLNKNIPDTAKGILLLRLSIYNILKPGEKKPDLDSAALFINQAKSMSIKVKSQQFNGCLTLVEAYLYRERGKKDEAKKYAVKALDILKNVDDNYHLGEAYFELSQYFDYMDATQSKEKIRLVEQAVQAFQRSGHIELYAFTLKFLADLYNLGGNTPKALEIAKISLQSYNSIHYPLLQGLYSLLADISYKLGDYPKALNYELTALKTAERNRDTTMQLCEINNGIGIILTMLHEREKSIYHYKRALQIAEKYNDKSGVMLLVQNIVASYILLNKPADALIFINNIPKKYLVADNERANLSIISDYFIIYSHMKRYREAKHYCNLLIEGIRNSRLEDLASLDGYLVDIIKFYIENRQSFNARLYLIKLDSLIQKIHNPHTLRESFLLKFQLDTAQKDFRSATRHLLQFQQMNDSLFNETKSKQIKQMEVIYETEKKEGEIKLKDQNIRLLNQKNELQQEELQKAVRLRNETVAAIVILLISGVLFYRQYRQKQLANNIITKQNANITHKNQLLQHLLTEKEWLLKEVHHRVKNNLHTVICLLESQAAYLENDALKAIENTQHRIYAMSLIHQKLYQSDDIKSIDMAVYLPEFVRYLSDSFGRQDKIRFQLEIEPLMLGVSQAIPIALIINEAATNSIKYAFPGERKGIIEIAMHQSAEQISVIIADNGIGIDPALANTRSESLGLKLINGLSEDINASISIINTKGTKITIIFSVDPLNDSNSFLTSSIYENVN